MNGKYNRKMTLDNDFNKCWSKNTSFILLLLFFWKYAICITLQKVASNLPSTLLTTHFSEQSLVIKKMKKSIVWIVTSNDDILCALFIIIIIIFYFIRFFCFFFFFFLKNYDFLKKIFWDHLTKKSKKNFLYYYKHIIEYDHNHIDKTF